MLRHAIVLLPLAVGLAACNTTYYAPGAAGRVVDADTGKPLRGASVTREAIGRASFAPGPDGRIDYQSVLVPAEGVPAEKVVTDQSGRFEIRPAGRTQIAFLYSHNASGLDCKVLVTKRMRYRDWRVQRHSGGLILEKYY